MTNPTLKEVLATANQQIQVLQDDDLTEISGGNVADSKLGDFSKLLSCDTLCNS